jgi:hypothetical protein
MRIGLLTAAVFAAVALSACTSSGSSPSVPSLGGATHAASPGSAACIGAAEELNLLTGGNTPSPDASPSTGASPSTSASQGTGGGEGSGGDKGYRPTCVGTTGDARKNALHAAADCIRRHGIPTYTDPVLTADGHVYTDARSLQDADENTVQAVVQACTNLILAAQLVPDGQAPAPPKLVQAGVKAAQCMRANGLPNYHDPTANSLFTPGHGFSIQAGDLPGDKTDPTVQHAAQACRSVLDAEARASSLGSLGE